MSNFFEVTTDDIIIIVARMGKNIDVEKASELMDELDFQEIENAAASEIELEDQTSQVYKEIENQLKNII